VFPVENLGCDVREKFTVYSALPAALR
jgi:hypothetical protein